ncbi:MAG: hypothetical protein PHW24_00695 [Candidatus Moranbacteria bacterium]|nr:hypothetical protein [Candidatus Moranbacteria bacterium]
MDKNFKDIFNSLNVEPPKGLKQAVFERIEKEKLKKIARKRLFIQMGFAASGISSIVAVAIFGQEILTSDFFRIATLGFSDLKTVGILWQDYVFSLLETLPTATMVAMLLPIFVFLELLRQYGKLENSKIGIVHLSSRT